ncbi:hypothetical protein [Microcoleus sp. CAWBG58]|nr:hypothetical protein [Microcoleus sp. CAWBG58]
MKLFATIVNVICQLSTVNCQLSTVNCQLNECGALSGDRTIIVFLYR